MGLLILLEDDSTRILSWFVLLYRLNRCLPHYARTGAGTCRVARRFRRCAGLITKRPSLDPSTCVDGALHRLHEPACVRP